MGKNMVARETVRHRPATSVTYLALGLSALVVALSPGPAYALRIVTWNVTNYNGGSTSDIQTAVYGVFSGRCLCPDAIVVQEFESSFAVNDFLSALNSAGGSPGDWAAAAFVDGADTDSAFFYRTGEIVLATDLSVNGVTVVSVGSSSPANHPRNIMRYDIRPAGYTSPESTIAIYSTHMKAGSSGTDLSRRLVEAEEIRDDAETLPAGWNFILAGDINMQDSFESAYVELIGAQANNDGRFFDPISTPGNWNNNFNFRFVHTQDPATQMDDRFDTILVSASLIDGIDFEYDGNPAIPFSTSTWNDPNHSYRAYGNDGTTYNNVLRTTGNAMVGSAIAQAIINLADGNGHVPVFAEFIPPANDLGACCTPCGCDDLLNESQCIAAGGSFRGIGVECGMEVPACTVPNTARINELRVIHDGVTQDQEFVEIVGDPGQPLCGLSLVAIEGELSSKGRVDFVVSLDECGSGQLCTLDSNGYFVAGGSGVNPDLELFFGANIFENGTQTLLLVRDTQLTTGSPNNDVDGDNDGVEDVAPAIVGTLLDVVAVIDDDYFAGFEPDAVYFGAAPIGPASDGTVAAGAARCPDGSDTDSPLDWTQISRDVAQTTGCVGGTPGAANPNHCGGDDDQDGDLDLRDFAAFQDCYGQSTAACAVFDLDGSCTVDAGDVSRFQERLDLSGP
jgi:endonuclease/exonuclease/phosphatase family metal-dependent hydrolase